MDIVIQLVDALVWPVTVLLLVCLLRNELRGLLARLSSLKYKDLEAKFERELEAIEAEVEAIPSRHDLPSSAAVEQDRMLRLAAISSRASIIEAWREVELATKDVARAKSIDIPRAIASVKVIRQLAECGLINDDILSIYNRLRHLRNQAAHARDFEINADEAQRYATLALELAWTLRSKIQTDT